MASEIVEQLKRIRQNLLDEIEEETAYRARNGAKPTYTSSTGKHVDWNGWLKGMWEAIADVNAKIGVENAKDDPYELRTTGWT